MINVCLALCLSFGFLSEEKFYNSTYDEQIISICNVWVDVEIKDRTIEQAVDDFYKAYLRAIKKHPHYVFILRNKIHNFDTISIKGKIKVIDFINMLKKHDIKVSIDIEKKILKLE